MHTFVHALRRAERVALGREALVCGDVRLTYADFLARCRAFYWLLAPELERPFSSRPLFQVLDQDGEPVPVSVIRFDASGLKVNSAVAVPSNGFKKSSLIWISSWGRLSVIVMLPSPTSSLPAQRKIAPVPSEGPSNEFLAAGSSFAHGDQSFQR